MIIRYLLVLLTYLSCFSTLAYADCPTPQNLYNYNPTHSAANLSWSYYTSANNSPSYQMQWRPAGNTNWTIVPAITSTSYSLTGLTNNTTYEWRLRAVCAPGDTSAFSSVQAFQTKCLPPYYLSTATVGTQSVKLNWNLQVYGGSAEVQWRAAGSSNWNIVSNITNNYLVLANLPSDTYFEWKVRCLCSAEASSEFVTGPLFQTQCPLPTNLRATLTNPDAIELKWNSGLTNVRFDLQWRVAGVSTWNLVENIPLTEYAITGLTNETTYEWQVRTVCNATSKSDFTEVQTVRTRCPLPADVSTGSVDYNSATLQWSYSFPVNLQWRQAGTATWTTVSGVSAPYRLTGLSSNTVYEWRIQGACPTSAVSVYTPSQVFTTQCSLPTYPYAYKWASDGLQFFWTGPAGNTYELQYRIVGEASWSVITGITKTPYTKTGLLVGATYEWRVRQVCSQTESSDFVNGALVSISCSYPWNIHVENPTVSSIDLVWEDSAPGTYEIQWRANNMSTWTNVTGITTTRYSLTNLAANTYYVWQVRKICSSLASSEFSYSQTFSLTCQQPTNFNSTNITGTSATLSWFDYYVSSPYELQYRPIGSASWVSVSGLTSTQYTLTNLTSNTTYEWRVRSACFSDFSPIQTFLVQCGQFFSDLSVQNIGVTSAELRWYNAGSTNRYEIQYREYTSSDWIILRPDGSETDPSYGVENNGIAKRYRLYGLTPGRTYTWRVRQVCSESIYSDFRNGGPFTTNCGVPTFDYYYQQSDASVYIQWNSSIYTSSYELQWRPSGSTTWNSITGLTNKYYSLSNLTLGTAYEVRVRQQCSQTIASDFSNILSVQMQCGVPWITAYDILSPTSVQLNWGYTNDEFTNSRRYDLQYRVSGTSSWTTIAGIAGKTYSLTGLTTGVTYEYQVRAECKPGVTSAYTPIVSVRIDCQIELSLNSQAASTSAKLSWSVYYGSPSEAFALQWRPSGTSVWSEIAVTGAEYLLTGLTTGNTYEWRVGSRCNASFPLIFSSIQTFQTNCPTVWYTSVDGVGSSKALIKWPVVNLPSEVTYSVQYRIRGTVAWTTIGDLTGSSVLLTALKSNAIYEYRVLVLCGASVSTSDVGSFWTECKSPTNLTARNITIQSAQLTWTANLDSAPVDLQWRQVNSNTAWNEVTNLVSPTYSLTGLLSGTDYEYRLRSVCSGSDQSMYSNTTSFQTYQSSPPSSSFFVSVDSLSGAFARITWSDVGPNATYRFQWREVNGEWNTSGLLTSRIYLLTDLKIGQYEVRAGYTTGGAPIVYSSTRTFTTSCPKPYTSFVSGITPKGATLNWTDIKTPVTIQWRMGGANTWNSIPGVTGATYSLTGLVDNTFYEWRVLTSCSSTTDMATYPVAFKTGCLMPTSTYTLNVSSSSAGLGWVGPNITYAVRYRILGATDWATLTNIQSVPYSLTGLANNTTYEWAVATVCENTANVYTSASQFTTQCAAPTNLSIYSYYVDRALLTWNGAESAYQLQWRVAGNSAWNTVQNATAPYLLSGLSTGVTYEWRIRGVCAVAGDGAFKVGPSFSVSCPDVYFYPFTTNITSGSAQVNWNMSSVANYVVRWRAAGVNTWTTSPASVTSPYVLTGLTNNTIYEWQVRTDCQTDFSNTTVFQTTCKAPDNLRAETVTATSALLRWNDSGENVAYELQWRVAGALDWNKVTNLTGTSYQLPGLTGYTSYEWQVRSLCAGGSTFQTTATFKTLDACTQGITTIRNGNWDDPTIWSCNRIPTSTDKVQLMHSVSVGSGYAAKALRLQYSAGGKLSFATGATIKLGQ